MTELERNHAVVNDLRNQIKMRTEKLNKVQDLISRYEEETEALKRKLVLINQWTLLDSKVNFGYQAAFEQYANEVVNEAVEDVECSNCKYFTFEKSKKPCCYCCHNFGDRWASKE